MNINRLDLVALFVLDFTCFPAAGSQSLIVPSLEALANLRPSALKDIALIVSW